MEVVITVMVMIPAHRIPMIMETHRNPATIPPVYPIPIQRIYLDSEQPANPDRAAIPHRKVVVDRLSNSPGNRALSTMNGAGEGI